MEVQEQWVYYLKLQKTLPPEFLIVDQKLKTNLKSLVPISIKGLVEASKQGKSLHVVIVIRTVDELRYFNKSVKKYMKFLIRTGKVNIYIASSFSGINDSSIMRRDFYHFVKLPISTDYFCNSVSRTIDIKESKSHKWPGGMRSKFQLSS